MLSKKNIHWTLVLISIALFATYQLFIASDRYVSEANVVLESPQIAPATLEFSSLFNTGGARSSDMLLLRDYLLSFDMMKKVISEQPFREHYSSGEVDIFSRLLDRDAPQEELHEYYLSRVSVELDDYAQVLRVKVRAFSPEIAYAIHSLFAR